MRDDDIHRIINRLKRIQGARGGRSWFRVEIFRENRTLECFPYFGTLTTYVQAGDLRTSLDHKVAMSAKDFLRYIKNWLSDTRTYSVSKNENNEKIITITPN